jgi:hypothetical protein
VLFSLWNNVADLLISLSNFRGSTIAQSLKQAQPLTTLTPGGGRAMTQAVSRRPLTAAARVSTRVNPVRFVVDTVARAQVFLQVLRFFTVNIIPPWAPHSRKLKKNSSFTHPFTHSFSSGDGQWARKSGRSSVRRQSQPHNQNTGVEPPEEISKFRGFLVSQRNL